MHTPRAHLRIKPEKQKWCTTKTKGVNILVEINKDVPISNELLSFN